MTIKQLSIFLENKSGTLVKVLNLFKQSQIQLIAMTIADTAEYGICRIICSEPTRAWEVLKEAGVAVALTDVFAIELDNKPGCGADAIKVFSDAAPFTKRFGILVGITVGSGNVSSKFMVMSTVSLSKSSIIASPIILSRASV